jgi:hypothetical protein
MRRILENELHALLKVKSDHVVYVNSMLRTVDQVTSLKEVTNGGTLQEFVDLRGGKF